MLSSRTVPQVFEARVDWVTCTAKRGSGANELCAFVERVQEGEKLAGDKWQDWRFQGYQGFSCGHARWGWGKSGAIAVLSGEPAHTWAPDLARLADHWSRVDYAVTTFDVSDDREYADELWAQWQTTDQRHRNAVSLGRVQKYAKGATVTLGERTSATYFRAYDKYWESKGDYALGCWRWELELKREQAEAQQALWRTNVVFPHYILGLVRGWPEAHGLQLPWPAEAKLEPCHQLKASRDADRTLAWLKTQVAPSVEWVAQARGEDAVKEVLGLKIGRD